MSRNTLMFLSRTIRTHSVHVVTLKLRDIIPKVNLGVSFLFSVIRSKLRSFLRLAQTPLGLGYFGIVVCWTVSRVCVPCGHRPCMILGNPPLIVAQIGPPTQSQGFRAPPSPTPMNSQGVWRFLKSIRNEVNQSRGQSEPRSIRAECPVQYGWLVFKQVGFQKNWECCWKL